MTPPTAAPLPANRLAPGLWAALATVAAVVASVLAGALADTTLPVLLGTSITRSGMDAAGVGCVGLTLVGVLLPLTGPDGRAAAAVQIAGNRLLVVLAGGWLVLVLLGVAFRAADAFGRPVTAIDAAEVLSWATDLAAGRGMLLTAGCAAVVLGCAIVRQRRPEQVPVRIPLVAALLGVLTPTVTGHASSAPDHQLAVTTTALHVGAAALWVGGLGGLLVLVARRGDLLAATLPRFSRLAGFCVFAVAVTGVLNALVRLESSAALVTTGYGWLVIAKAVAVALLGGLGGLARRRLSAGRTPVLRWAGLEVALMAVTLGLAAALTQTA